MVNTTPQEYITRLTPEVYASLESKFKPPLVTDSTSPIQAGYQLGVQAVLKELRAGYVISTR